MTNMPIDSIIAENATLRAEVERLRQWVPDHIENASAIAKAFLDSWGLRWGTNDDGDQVFPEPPAGSALAEIDLAMRIQGYTDVQIRAALAVVAIASSP